MSLRPHILLTLIAGLALAACNDDEGEPSRASLKVKGLTLAAFDTLKGHATLT